MRTPSEHPPVRPATRRWLPARLVLALLPAAFLLAAHAAAPPLSLQKAMLPITDAAQVVLPATDVAAELAADAKDGNVTPVSYTHLTLPTKRIV